MTALSELLRLLLGALQPRLLTLPSIPTEPTQMQRVAQSIKCRWPEEPELREQDPGKLAIAMAKRLQRQDWKGFTWEDAQRTAIALLRSERKLWREARFKALLEFLLRQIWPHGNRNYTRTMYNTYLITFDKNSYLTQRLADILRYHWGETGLPIQQLVTTLKVFNKDSADQTIADFMDGQDTPFAALGKIGVEDPHAGGLMQAAHGCFVNKQVQRIKAGEYDSVAPKLLAWIISPHPSSALKEGAGVAIDALLLPWTDPRIALEEMRKNTFKETLKHRLIDAYGDPRFPRIRRVSLAWESSSDAAKKVIFSWMVGDTIKFFFEIISEADTSHMWTDRKQLWIDQYDNGCISEAYFALSLQGKATAQRLANDRNSPLEITSALNVSSGSGDRKKCLLLMKINDRWVVEGSHSFKTHIFYRGDDESVKPYLESYTCDQFRYMVGKWEPLRFAHYSNWRNKVEDAIRQ